MLKFYTSSKPAYEGSGNLCITFGLLISVSWYAEIKKTILKYKKKLLILF